MQAALRESTYAFHVSCFFPSPSNVGQNLEPNFGFNGPCASLFIPHCWIPIFVVVDQG